MIVKVCGIVSKENLEDISTLDFAMIGFNFYPPSKRFLQSVIHLKKDNFKRVGVFVNCPISRLKDIVQEHRLDFIQLHGDETPDYCTAASAIAPIIKVFGVHESFDFNICKQFTATSKYFLFDTFTKAYGGSGNKFDWSVLNNYNLETEFILSGGISIEDIPAIHEISHPKFIGVDLNSRFELEAGIKDVNKLKQFKHGILKDSKLSKTGT